MKNFFGILFITLATYKNGVYCKGNIYENHTLVGLIPSSEDQLMNLISFENPSKDILVMKPSRAVKDSYDLLVPPDSMKVIKEYAKEHKLGFEVKKKNYGRSFQPLQREPKRRSGKGFNLFNFNSHGSMQEFIDQIAKKHPDLVTLENVGQSYEKRRMRLVKISSKPSNLNPVIFIDAGVHSREWVAPAMAMYLINRLTNDPESRKSDLKNVDWYILPLVNPDGYEYTRTSLNNRMWRKTRSPHGKCFGVDGNRNYDYKWASSGVSHDPCDSEIFAGPSAFSEVETRTVRNIMKKYASRIKLYVSLHAYGQYLVYPWGYTGNFLPDNWRKLHKFAKSASNAVVEAGGDEFTVMSAGQWYPAAGASDDYSFGAVGIPYAYTMELTKGHDFVYPSSLLRKVLPEFYAGFKSFGEQIRKEFSPAAKQVKHVRKSKDVKEVIKKPQEPSKHSEEDYDVKIKVED